MSRTYNTEPIRLRFERAYEQGYVVHQHDRLGVRYARFYVGNFSCAVRLSHRDEEFDAFMRQALKDQVYDDTEVVFGKPNEDGLVRGTVYLIVYQRLNVVCPADDETQDPVRAASRIFSPCRLDWKGYVKDHGYRRKDIRFWDPEKRKERLNKARERDVLRQVVKEYRAEGDVGAISDIL